MASIVRFLSRPGAPPHTHMDTASLTLALVLLALLLVIGGTALSAIASAPRLGGPGDPQAPAAAVAQKKKAN